MLSRHMYLNRRFLPASFGLVILAGLLACELAGAGEPPRLTTADLLTIVKSPARRPEDRVRAAEALGNISDPRNERDNRVVEELIEVVKTANDIFVRIEAIKALGKIQVNLTALDKRSKTRYLPIFVPLLRSTTEHGLIRAAVLQVFRDTLDPNDLPDREAYKVVLEIAKNKGEPNIGLRIRAISAVGQFGAADALDALAPLLVEQEPLVKEAAGQALEQALLKVTDPTLPPATINRLIEVLADKNAPVDTRISFMRVLAQLIRANNPSANRALDILLEITAKEEDDLLVKGAVEALGIIGSAVAVENLKKVFDDYLKTTPQTPTKLAVRLAVINAFQSILATQAEIRTHDARIVKESATFLIRAVEEDPAAEAKASALYVMRYLYPKRFETEHVEAIKLLLFLLQRPATDAQLKSRTIETLEAITGLSLADERRWREWFAAKYPR